MAKTVKFTFDERSLTSLENMVDRDNDSLTSVLVTVKGQLRTIYIPKLDQRCPTCGRLLRNPR